MSRPSSKQIHKLRAGRTIKETRRLHEQAKVKEPLPKPKRQKAKIPLPEDDDISDYAFDSDPEGLTSDNDLDGTDFDTLDGEDDEDDEDDEELNGAYDEDEASESEEEAGDPRERRKRKKHDAVEADYETAGRARWADRPQEEEDETDHADVGRLPIKLPSGEVQQREGTTRIALPPTKKRKPAPPESDEDEEEPSEEEDSDAGVQAQKLAGKKGRFGRKGIAEIVAGPGKNADKLAMAKEQIAAASAEILAGGELVDIVSLVQSGG